MAAYQASQGCMPFIEQALEQGVGGGGAMSDGSLLPKDAQHTAKVFFAYGGAYTVRPRQCPPMGGAFMLNETTG